MNKVKDESHQALSAFIYLMTAPMIWKIREIYRKSNFSKSADQIPLSMVLIGRGTTGKTLLVRDYFKNLLETSLIVCNTLKLMMVMVLEPIKQLDF